jgi:pimeloyl-ACP methyl ester carboxylesterase
MVLTADCKESLQGKGYDFAAYNSMASAKDIDQLKRHLGYEQMVLFGGSYGTRLAFTYAREFPRSVESMVLTGLFPVEIDLYAKVITNLKRSTDLFFKECEASEECNKRYPNLKKRFYNTVSRLRVDPFEVSVDEGNIIINAQDYLLLVHQYLYVRSLYSEIPKLILSVENNDQRAIINAMKNFSYVFKLINGPMYWSVNAYEELPFNGYNEIEKDLQKNPELAPGPGFFMSDPGMLAQWHSHRAPVLENKSVQTSIPTLLINGEYDPITPPANATESMKYLSHSFYKEFKGEGHSILNDCFTSIMKEFISNPTRVPENNCNRYPAPIDW